MTDDFPHGFERLSWASEYTKLSTWGLWAVRCGGYVLVLAGGVLIAAWMTTWVPSLMMGLSD